MICRLASAYAYAGSWRGWSMRRSSARLRIWENSCSSSALESGLRSCKAAPAGEVRRACEVISEVVIVYAGPPVTEVGSAVRGVLRDVTASARGVEGRHPAGPPVRIEVAPESSFGAALLWHTGSTRHLHELSALAQTAGLMLADAVLTDASGEAVTCPDERAAYERLGLPWIAPELREGEGEVEAAATGTLPALVEEGDVLLIRTGRAAMRKAKGGWDPMGVGLPGLDASCLPWLHERKIAVLGSDSVSDVVPSGLDDVPLPIHVGTLVVMGIHLIDNADFDALSSACGASRRYEFLFTMGPLILLRGTASPVNPIAIL